MENKDRNIEITVFETDYAEGEFPKSPSEFFAYFQQYLEQIPEEYRENAKRPETEEEKQERVKREQIQADRTRERELATLAELKAKYNS